MQRVVEAKCNRCDLVTLPPTSMDSPIIGEPEMLENKFERTIPDLWEAIRIAVDAFTPTDCQNYFTAAGITQFDRKMLQMFFTSHASLQRRASRIASLFPEFLLDPDQLIIFREPVRARKRTGFDLAAIGRDGEIADG